MFLISRFYVELVFDMLFPISSSFSVFSDLLILQKVVEENMFFARRVIFFLRK